MKGAALFTLDWLVTDSSGHFGYCAFHFTGE